MSARPPGRGITAIAGCLGVALIAALAALVLLRAGAPGGASAPTAVTAPPLPSPAPSGAVAVTPEVGPPGGALLIERFDRAARSRFVAEEDEVARYGFEGGGYTIEVKAPETVVWTLAGGPYGDVDVSVDAVVPDDAQSAAAGVIFHYQDDGNFYLFQVSSSGYYMLELLADNAFSTLIDWTQSDAIDPVANQLRVETRGDRIALYVNGRRLEETRDGSFTRGEVGIATSSFAEPGAAIRFDNLMIVQSEPDAP